MMKLTNSRGMQRRIQKVDPFMDLDTINIGLDDDSSILQQSDYNYTNSLYSARDIPIEESPLRGNTWKKGELLFDKKQLEREAAMAMYNERLDMESPIENSRISYPQIESIPIEVIADVPAVWNFCVAYAATGMYRKGTADDIIAKQSGGNIGTWYLGALTLFYSFYEVTIGAIPPLMTVSQELADLFHACTPTSKNGRSYVIRWPFNDIVAALATLPYNSFAQPLITLAPLTGAFDAFGRPVISNTIPVVTLDDIIETGPRAFEYVQRYLLSENIPLIPYTNQGRYSQNTSVFACWRDPSNANPVPGFVQVVNESPLPQRDYWLMCLGFFHTSTGRDSFNTRTVQIGTHLAVLRILKGGVTCDNHSLVHMIDVGTIIAQQLSIMVGADFNMLDNQTLKDLDSIPIFPSEYLTQLTMGEVLTVILADNSRRFGLLSAMSAGNVLTDTASRIIGAGSRFISLATADSSVGVANVSEDLAALSSFEDGTFQMPVLTTRGTSLTGDMNTLGGKSLLYWLHSVFPTTQNVVISYDMAAPSPTDLPDIVDLTLNVSLTSGQPVNAAIATVSSVLSLMQGSTQISSATGSRDGPRTRHLYLTHYMDNATSVNNYNIVPRLKVLRVMSTKHFDPRTVATIITRLMPVAFGTNLLVSAYQTLYNRVFSTEVGITYQQYRASTFGAVAHKNAANLFAPSEQNARVAHDTIIGLGGNFIDVFFKNGRWVDALENLAGGIGDIFGPKIGKGARKIAGMVGSGLHKAFAKTGLSDMHLAPVSNGLVSLDRYMAAMDQMSQLKRNLVQRKVNSGKLKKIVK